MRIHFAAILLCVLSTYFGVITSIAKGSEDSAAILVPSLIDTQEGDLPKGWQGPDALSVRKDGDRAWIEASSAGSHEMKSPKFDVATDFDLDLSVELRKGTSASGSEIGIAFETQNGETMKLLLGQANPGIGTNQWTVSLGDSSKRIDAALDKPVPVRLRRVGRVYSVAVDGKVVISRRMSQFTGFSRLRIALTGPENDRGMRIAKLHSVSLKANDQ